ncbi:MAG: hypothetical protein ACFFBL_05395 [Promethearchaeota archaeon]
MELKVNRVLGLVIVCLTLTLMTAAPAAASGYTYNAKYIYVGDNLWWDYPSGALTDPTWIYLFVSGHWRESGFGWIYFYDATHRVTILDIPPHHKVKNVILRGITDSYDTTSFRPQMNAGDSLTIARGNIMSDGIMVILDCDVVVPVWYSRIYFFGLYIVWYIHHYETVHVHDSLSFDISDTWAGWKPALYLGPKLRY